MDWHAWNEEAFARARSEDKPIFLDRLLDATGAIMEHESFESDDIAAP